ncbi:tryptophan dimethylallyltransferase-domain-containing protein [Auriculariales sp. MPI-PUGE-AT-0066]|nr:tryptophan dimethylallyltransferase-domain-containing protein [Auriculariales sp. MPI-PUGE-AT-0066]
MPAGLLLSSVTGIAALMVVLVLFVITWFLSPANLALAEVVLHTPPRYLRRTLWWHRNIGRKLDQMLQLSQLGTASRRRNLRFFLERLVPHFGPSPPEFALLANDTSYRPIVRTPIELIWVLDGKRPMSVRFSMEMLDDCTGRPLSVEQFAAATRGVFAPGTGESAKDYDSTWPDICYSTMLDHEWRKRSGDVNKIQFFPGGEFGPDGITGKLYYYPARAAATGLHGFDVIGACVSRLGLTEQWAPVIDFLRANPHYGATPDFVGVEAVAPQRNRFKVYVRISSDYSSLNEISRIATLDGGLRHPAVAETVLSFARFWHLMYPGRRDDEVVPSLRPAGRMGLGRKEVVPKIYIPAYRFEGNDEHVARVITQYHRIYDQGGELEKNYETHFKRIFTGYNLQQKLPLIHTYIGMATKNNTTQMTVYLALDPFGVAKT